MDKKAVAIILSFLFSGLMLVGCGGGGGGSNDDDTEPPPSDTPAVFALSGTIQPAGGNAIDSDVNDPYAPFERNDEPGAAQRIPNPVTVGGHVNQPGIGSTGRTWLNGDIQDWYRVTLAAGQTINLFMASNPFSNQLTLTITDLGGNVLQQSNEPFAKTQTLKVATTGEQLILVQMLRGASNYILTVGQQLEIAERAKLDTAEFVPGEVIVRFKDEAPVTGDGLKAQLQVMGMMPSGAVRQRNRLLKLEALEQLEAYRVLDPEPLKKSAGQASRAALRDYTLRMVEALNRHPDVLYASPNYIYRPLFVPNDPFYPQQWHYPLLNLPQAWDLSTGDGVVVAVLDTGILPGHPDLQGQLAPGYDFIRDPENAGDGDGIDPDPTDPGISTSTRGSLFHGTHVAGTVAAATHNAFGVVGVAFSAQVMPLRVIGTFGGTNYDVEQAVRFAAGLDNDVDESLGRNPQRRADIINLSLGGFFTSPDSQAVYDRARANGVVIVAAAGNDASALLSFPAALNGVIAVSAVDLNKNLTSYSSFGAYIDVAAPGGDTGRDRNGDGNPDGVLSTSASEASGSLVFDYTFLQGTSMAAPHMAGVVALMRAVNPELMPADVDNLLASGSITDDLGAPGHDDLFGHGLINAYKAVVAAANLGSGSPVAEQPILVATPAALNFGLNQTQLTVTLSNGGGSTLTVTGVSDDSGGWLNVASSANAAGLGVYRITVRRGELADGVYTATLTFTSNANTVRVPVIMQVANNLSTGEIGQHYAIIVDSLTGETVDSVAATRQSDGRYAYRFAAIPEGAYEIVAGTDSDNDGFICDAGEACGAYLTLDEPIDLTVDRDRADLDFVSGFIINFADVQSAIETQPKRGFARQKRRAPKQF